MQFRHVAPLRWSHFALLLCVSAMYLVVLAQTSEDVVLTSPGNIPLRCFTQAASTTNAQTCRTISFCFSNGFGGFAVTRTPSDFAGLTVYFVSVVMALGPVSVETGAETVPWNLASQYAALLTGTVVTSNGTCLRVALPPLPLLDVPQGVRYTLAFDLSVSELYVRPQSNRISTNGTLSYLVGIVFSDVPSQLVSLGPLSLAHVAIAGLCVWTPYPAVMPEAVLAIAAATQSCMQPNVRQVALSLSRWALSLWGGVDKSHEVLLWRAAVVLFLPLGLHLLMLVVLHVVVEPWRQRKRSADSSSSEATHRRGGRHGGGGYAAIVAAVPWATSCEASSFPWLSGAWLELWLAPMCFQAVVVLMLSTAEERASGVGSVFLATATMLVVVAWCIVPVVVLRYHPDLFCPIKLRSAGPVLARLPALLKILLPGKTWGPLSYAAVWRKPFLACREQCLRYGNVTWASTLVVMLLLGYKPETAEPCVGLQVVAALVLLAAAVVLLWLRPFRCKVLSVLLSVEYAVLAVVLMVSAARAKDTPPPGVGIDLGVQSLLVMLHVVGMLRGLGTLAAALAEHFFVAPLVWPSYERISTIADLMKRSAPEFPLLEEEIAEKVYDVEGEMGAVVDEQAIRRCEGRTEAANTTSADGQRRSRRGEFPLDTFVPREEVHSVRDKRSETHEDGRRQRVAAAGEVNEDEGNSDDDDFFEQCRRRRGKALAALGLPSSLDGGAVHNPGGSTTYERRMSHAHLPSSSWTSRVLDQQSSESHRSQRRSTMSTAATRGLVQLAESEQSKTLLRGPMERLVQEKGIVPPCIAHHRRLEEEML